MEIKNKTVHFVTNNPLRRSEEVILSSNAPEGHPGNPCEAKPEAPVKSNPWNQVARGNLRFFGDVTRVISAEKLKTSSKLPATA